MNRVETTKQNELGNKLGRIFEVGFNLGILTYMQQKNYTNDFGSLYQQDLAKLNLNKLTNQIIVEERISDPTGIQLVKKWVTFFLQKGWLSGLNFFHEYTDFAAKASSGSGSRAARLGAAPIVRYYQCSFSDDNSLGLINRGSAENFKQQLAAQFKDLEDVSSMVSRYVLKKGEFAQADTLMLLEYRHEYRILCIDLSIFFIKSIRDLRDLEDIEVQRGILLSEINYLRSKSVFSGLSIDSGPLALTFSPGLESYITAFARSDKESYKLIQAASYTHSFYNFLVEKNLIIAATPAIPTDTSLSSAEPISQTKPADQNESIENTGQRETNVSKNPTKLVIFNIVGYSDRGISAMTVTPENLEMLATCAKIYKSASSDQPIENIRRKVLNLLKHTASRSFADAVKGRNFLDQLLDTSGRQSLNSNWSSLGNDVAVDNEPILEVTYQEQVDGFVNSVSEVGPDLLEKLGLVPQGKNLLRDCHAQLIKQKLAATAPETFLFLTGNPGIGKTTAIVDYLVEHQEEGFLFFYVSPRKQVNLDVIKKFRDPHTNRFRVSNFLGINTNSDIIRENGGNFTVNYVSDKLHGNFDKASVAFIQNEETFNLDDGVEDTSGLGPSKKFSNSRRQKTIARKTEDLISETGGVNRGVLASISEATYVALEENLATHIVATVSIQAFKKVVSSGGNTLEHFKKIFRSGLNGDRAIPAKMRQLSAKLQNVFIMVDEITGDDSGVEFLNEISTILTNIGLLEPTNGFNTKIIVADASIVDTDIIRQHLSSGGAEPDKIFFRKVQTAPEALSVEDFQFKRRAACVINANSYPAAQLQITYKTFMSVFEFDAKTFFKRQSDLRDLVQDKIALDIHALLDKPTSSQVIVYIQDKRRLADLIERIKLERFARGKTEFQEGRDYIQIHADLSEEKKQQLESYKDEVKIVFMTASASRGLSFPNTRHILVDVPGFEIENNLMEIIQVIYRGRGGDLDVQEKELVFYLADRAVYYPPPPSNSPSSGLATAAAEEGEGEAENEKGNTAQKARQLAIQESGLNLINILLILKTSIMTRINGYGQLGRSHYMMVPIGGKSVYAAGESFSSRMSNLIKDLQKKQLERPSDKGLKQATQVLGNLFSHSEILVREIENSPKNEKEQSGGAKSKERVLIKPKSYLSLLHNANFETSFQNLANASLEKLLQIPALELGYISGNLLIVPLGEKPVEESYQMGLWDQIEKLNPETIRLMRGIAFNRHDYPESLRSQMLQALDFIEEIRKDSITKSQRFEQNNGPRSDQYYAIPLLNFIAGSAIQAYYAEEGEGARRRRQDEEADEAYFRDILATYVRSLFPADGMLPISPRYGEFPFVVFRSFSLMEMRRKLFTDRQLLTSNELNVLNMVLSNEGIT